MTITYNVIRCHFCGGLGTCFCAQTDIDFFIVEPSQPTGSVFVDLLDHDIETLRLFAPFFGGHSWVSCNNSTAEFTCNRVTAHDGLHLQWNHYPELGLCPVAAWRGL